MTRTEAWLTHAANVLVGGTGLVYAWMLYLVEPVDELAVVHHPAQPLVQHAHVWTAPLLVFALGLLWRNHAWAGAVSGKAARRRSGITLMATAAPMILSGYLLQTAVEPDWRTAWRTIHLTASVLWIVGTLVHQLSPRPRP